LSDDRKLKSAKMHFITQTVCYTISDHKISGNKSGKNIISNNLYTALQTKLGRIILKDWVLIDSIKITQNNIKYQS
jgi:hypothetical protein